MFLKMLMKTETAEKERKGESVRLQDAYPQSESLYINGGYWDL